MFGLTLSGTAFLRDNAERHGDNPAGVVQLMARSRRSDGAAELYVAGATLVWRGPDDNGECLSSCLH